MPPVMLPSITYWLILVTTLHFCRASTPRIEPSYVKLVDLVSSSPEHSHLLLALQRARLIPILNRLNGSTLFAPTNKAIEKQIDRERSLTVDQGLGGTSAHLWSYAVLGADTHLTDQQHDNLQLELRDTLLYHVLNYTLPLSGNSNSTDSPTWPRATTPELAETLYHPSLSPYNKSFPRPPSLPGSPRDGPDPDRPHAVQGLLRGQGQLLRWYMEGPLDNLLGYDSKSNHSGPILHVGVDWQGQGGARGDMRQSLNASNGWLLPVDQVLQKPVDIATHIRTNPDLSTLSSLLPTSILNYISTAPHLTVFAPTNQAWGSLSELEMRYLRSGLAEDDLTQILGESVSSSGAGKGKVGYLARLLGIHRNNTAEVTTVWNTSLEIRPGDDTVPAVVNDTAIATPDILAMNGVIHTVPSLLLSSGSLALTVEKYLIALNCTRFVSLLRSVNLSHYVQAPVNSRDTTMVTRLPVGDALSAQLPFSTALDSLVDDDTDAYTILAPRDDVIDTHWPQLQAFLAASMPEQGSDALRDVLSYHIIRGKWTPTELEDGMLVSTVLQTDELRSSSQRLLVSVQRDEGDDDNTSWWSRHIASGGNQHKKSGVVGFGGASVIAEPVRVGKSIIYLLSSVLSPPSSPITEAVSDLRLSTFVASVYAAELDKELSQQPGITFLMPDNTAFSSLGLVMSYLLLPTARDELRSVLRYHAIDQIAYISELAAVPGGRGGAHAFPTLDGGSELFIERRGDHSASTPVRSIGAGASDPVLPSLRIRGPTVGGVSLNGDARAGRILEGDLLTSTGVIHIVDQVELPPELDITIPKLLQGAKASTMVDLIRAANLSWVLDGTTSSAESRAHGGGDRGKKREDQGGDDDDDDGDNTGLDRNQAYTILCPTDKALSRLNLTRILNDPRALTALVKLHIIPTDASLLSGAVSLHQLSSRQKKLRRRRRRLARAAADNDDNDGNDDDDDGDDGDGEAGHSDERQTGRSPLSLTDEAAFPTLLDRRAGGPSRYGTVAFRRWGDEGWLVGVKSARGARGQTDAARVVAFGRASPRTAWAGRRDDDDDDDDDNHGGDGAASRVLTARKKEVSLRAGGGVLVIDAVLLPYEPSWLRRWAWSCAIGAGVVLVVVALVFAVRRLVLRRSTRDQDRSKARYEPVAADAREEIA